MVPVRSARTPEELNSYFETRFGFNLVNTSPSSSSSQPQQQSQSFNLPYNIQQHQQAPLPTYRINSPGIQFGFSPNIQINVHNTIEKFFDDDEEHSTDLPFFNENCLKMMHDMGYLMLKDDAHDIGYFRYISRRGYRPHVSRLHHWYIGTGFMVLAQMLGMVGKLREFMEVGSSLMGPGGDMSDMISEFSELQPEGQQSQLPPLRLENNQLVDDSTNRVLLCKSSINQTAPTQPALPKKLPTRQQVTRRLAVPSAPF